jgi:hypothetical protein
MTRRADEVKVTLYTLTGRQLYFFQVNPAYCRECDMTVHVVEKALSQMNGVNVRFEVKPWLTYAASSIFRGGYHPPVLIVDTKLVSQGVVPKTDEVKHAVLRTWEERTQQQRKKSSSGARKIRNIPR